MNTIGQPPEDRFGLKDKGIKPEDMAGITPEMFEQSGIAENLDNLSADELKAEISALKEQLQADAGGIAFGGDAIGLFENEEEGEDDPLGLAAYGTKEEIDALLAQGYTPDDIKAGKHLEGDEAETENTVTS
ncbi:MAG: hypothetical protein HRT47_03015 [Candidatus Caenarcaniphilales bacterium]|nr:hypothetical protein [Candidatus Caenarcaniphilales bacterium]